MYKIKSACKNGDKVIHTFYVLNEGSHTCYNSHAIITIPTGLVLNYRNSPNSNGDKTPILSTGVYNSSEFKWYVGKLDAGQMETITVELEITDEDLFGANDFVVDFKAISSCVQDESDDIDYLLIEKSCPSDSESECENLNITLV